MIVSQAFEQEVLFGGLGEGLVVKHVPADDCAPLVDLEVVLVEGADTVSVAFKYNTGKFAAWQIEGLKNHFLTLLAEIVGNPAGALDGYRIVAGPERELLMGFAAGQRVTYPGDGSVTGRIERKAREHPDAVAVVYEETTLSYRQLDERSNRLADHLQRVHRVGPRVRVALMCRRSERMIVALLGILKAGAAYVPIDADFPAARVAHLLKDSGAALLLTERGLAGPDAAAICAVRTLEDIAAESDRAPARAVPVAHQPEDPAYILYTSGTTGAPKGVVIRHKSLADYAQTFTDFFALSARDGVIQQAPLTFDTSVEEIFPVLCAGGRLILPREGGRDVNGLVDAIERCRATVLSTSPLVLNELNAHVSRLASLRLLISGGDRLEAANITHLFGKFPIYNTYGPTEATVCSLYGEVGAPGETPLIGRPIANRSVYILNPAGQLAPPGVWGEIGIAGEGLAAGYLNKPEETGRQFVPHPFAAGEILYKTGDVGRWLPDGRIEFGGRTDRQVKVRGHRVELAEVERALMACPRVENALVTVAGPGDPRETAVVAYFTGQGEITTAQLRGHLVQQLPPYAVPDRFIHLDAFPVTAHGKIDLGALPGVARTGSGPASQPADPGNAVEEILAAWWAEVLGKESVGCTDNFFEAGGNSIKCLQVTTRIHREFGVLVDFKSFFADPTIRAVAQRVNQLTGDAPRQSCRAIAALAGQPDYEVSDAQRRLWLLNQLERDTPAYNLSWQCAFRGEAASRAIGTAALALIERHEILRTNFTYREGQLRQVVHPFRPEQVAVRHLDLRGTRNPRKRLAKAAFRQAATPFDLGTEPLIRLNLVRLAEEEYVLLVTLHHIITDGWSMEVFLRELVTLAEAHLAGQAARLPALRIQYKDFAAWQNEWLGDEPVNRLRAYWVNQFAGEVPVLSLPACQPRPAFQTTHGRCRHFSFSGKSTRRLERFSRRNQVTLFTTLVAVLKVLFYRYTNQADIVVGVPVAGRTHPEADNQLGCFINTLPIRTRLGGADLFEEVLSKVQTALRDGYNHQDYPIDKLIDELGLQRDLSRSPLFNVLVVLEDYSIRNEHGVLNDWLTITEVDNHTSISDVLFEFSEHERGLHLKVRYNTDLFTGAFIEKFVRDFCRLAGRVTADARQRVADYDFLSAAEVRQLLAEFNDTARVYPEHCTIEELFEQQVRRDPAAVAVVCEDRSLTYGRVNEMANQFARFIRTEHGVSAGDRVGVLLERSEKAIVTILGILKAGAAFVPMDTDWPAERIRFILGDSGVKLLVTEDTYGPEGLRDPLPTVRLGALAGRLPAFAPHDPDYFRDRQGVAYIIYTSGSTGTPKGVVVEHQSLCNVAGAWREEYGLDVLPFRLLQMASIGFDVFVGDLCRSLLNGGQLVICPAETRVDPGKLYALIRARQINLLETTPGLAFPLMEHIDRAGGDTADLKLLILGSDTCLNEDFKRLTLRFAGNVRIINS
ncbi:MAG: amino acid adenylation domain-containing protein, partial [Cytophagales bacterium]|nr:amino acid adenylation domain-containing protein [Cytophagales bacterium]